MRKTFEVSPVSSENIPDLAKLAIDGREEMSFGNQLFSGELDRLTQHLQVLNALPEIKLFTASYEDELVGFLVLRTIGNDIALPERVLLVDNIFVSKKFRRQGVGHALLTRVVQIAEEQSVSDIYAIPVGFSRALQRFLVQMGFSSVANYKVASLATLQRKLASDGLVSSRPSKSIESLIARRRKDRANAFAAIS